MMVQNRTDRPWAINRNASRIGAQASWMDAQDIRRNANYLMDFMGAGQIYTFSGPGPGADINFGSTYPDYDWRDKYGLYQTFPVILAAPPRRDSSNPSRRLCGVLFPWRVVPGYYQDHCNRPAVIEWNHLDEDVSCYRGLYRGTAMLPDRWDEVDQWHTPNHNEPIHLHDRLSYNLLVDGDMRYAITDRFWVSGNDATISKDTTLKVTGDQSLKVVCTGTTNPYAEGPYLNGELDMVIGRDYTIKAYVRGDGSATPIIVCGGATIASGAATAQWQLIENDFTAAGASIQLMGSTSTTDKAVWFDGVTLREKGRFQYTPDVDGLFTVGFVRTDRIRVAALSIWHAPDLSLTDDQVLAKEIDLVSGRAIRGYTGTGQTSLGDLEYGLGSGVATYDVDDVERNTRRCLLQSGHPTGISTYLTGSYYNIRGGNDSYFKITSRNLKGETSGTISTIPCLYGECHGASVGTPAKVKYTSSVDSWELFVTSDTPALWYDTARLEVASTGDKVKIEFQAPEDGWIKIGAYSLWEDTYAQ
jgi:hypothetical protein